MKTKNIEKKLFSRTKIHKSEESRDKRHSPFPYVHLSFMMCLAVISFLLLFVSISVVTATTVIVNPGESSIQEAIYSLDSEGGIVELAVGIHTPTASIQIINKNNITIRGTGASREDTEIKYGTPRPTFSTFQIENSTDITIENMYIYSTDHSYLGKDSDAIKIVPFAENITISNIRVEYLSAGVHTYNMAGWGWPADNQWSQNITIKDCLFSHDREGITWWTTRNSTISDCEINHIQSWPGINMNRVNYDHVFRNNTIHHCGHEGIYLYSGNERIIIENNTCYSNSRGIRLHSSAVNIEIIDNDLYSNRYEGILLLAVNGYTFKNVNISNNRIYSNTEDGIEMRESGGVFAGSYNVEIASNTIFSNGEDGIHENIPYYTVSIRNNIIANNSYYGITQTNSAIFSTYNCIYNNLRGKYSGTVGNKIGDIDDNPLFYDSSNNNYHLNSTKGTWKGAGWQIMSTNSPCIDSGDPSDDYFNEPGYPHGHINMGAYGNTIEASVSGDIAPIPGDVYIWLEAEDADTVTPDFVTANDTSASNGEYLWIPEGTGWYPRKGEATYTIHINSTGDYVIWGTVKVPTGDDNTFFVQMDDDFEALWAINLSANWQWDVVNHWGNGEESNPGIDPIVFTLAAGEHTLKIKQREDGTKLDKMLITNNMSYVSPYIDSVSPRTNVTITPPQNESGWNNVSPVAITFFRSDSGSGISYTNYSKTSETGPWTTVNTATSTGTDAGNVADISEGGFNVTINNDGNTTIWYYSVDSDSNVEHVKDVTVKIDTTATGIISGIVTNTTGALIQGATVTVEGTVKSAETDANGVYTLTDVPINTYTVTCTAPDYQDSYQSNISVSEGVTTQVIFALISSAITPLGDLVGEWHFEEGTEGIAVDSSGNENNGIIHSASLTEGKVGTALEFDGGDDYVSIPNSPTLNPANEITLLAWVNPGVIPQDGYRKIIAKPYTNSSYPWQQYALTLHDNQFVFELNTEGTKDAIASTETVEPNTWYHVTGTYDGSEMRIYVNAALDGTIQKSGAIAAYPTDVHIGAGIYSDAKREYINGTVDEVKIYNRALSADEIQADYVAVSPVGLWRFDKGAGGVAVDSSGNENNGIIHGANMAAGKLDSALEFDGVADYVSIPNSPTLNPANEITLLAWVNPGVIPQDGYRKIIAKPYTNSAYPWQQYALTLHDNKFVFELNTEGTKDAIASTETVEPNTWYHVTGTYDGSEMRIYVNAALDGTIQKSGAIAAYPTDVHIGAGIYSDAKREYINGTVDEVKIYNCALSVDEIQADYEEGLNGAVNSLSGTITSLNSTGLVDATVTLATMEGTEIDTAQTDSSGHYTFTDVVPGDYNLTATKPRFWYNYSVITVTTGEPTTADILLGMKGDFNSNGDQADAGDLAKMGDAKEAGTSDVTYDLNGDGNLADEDDLTLLKNVSVGETVLV